MVKNPETGKFVHAYVHRLVMEKEIDRKLKRSEHVIHIDGDTFNNNLDNLEIVNGSQHAMNVSNSMWKEYRSTIGKPEYLGVVYLTKKEMEEYPKSD